MCQGAWQTFCAWQQPRSHRGWLSALGVWSQFLAHFCLLPSLCLRPWHAIQLPQNNFSMHLMTFWGCCHCCLAVWRAARSTCLWGAVIYLGACAHTITALGSALGSLFRCKALSLSAHTGESPLCCRIQLLSGEERCNYITGKFLEVLDVPEGL